jgi:hypothetical protein
VEPDEVPAGMARSRSSPHECRSQSALRCLSFAKTPSGGQVVDLSALIRRQSQLDDPSGRSPSHPELPPLSVAGPTASSCRLPCLRPAVYSLLAFLACRESMGRRQPSRTRFWRRTGGAPRAPGAVASTEQGALARGARRCLACGFCSRSGPASPDRRSARPAGASGSGQRGFRSPQTAARTVG